MIPWWLGIDTSCADTFSSFSKIFETNNEGGDFQVPIRRLTTSASDLFLRKIPIPNPELFWGWPKLFVGRRRRRRRHFCVDYFPMSDRKSLKRSDRRRDGDDEFEFCDLDKFNAKDNSSNCDWSKLIDTTTNRFRKICRSFDCFGERVGNEITFQLI